MKYVLLMVLLASCTPATEMQYNQHCIDYFGARFGRVYAEEQCGAQ